MTTRRPWTLLLAVLLLPGCDEPAPTAASGRSTSSSVPAVSPSVTGKGGDGASTSPSGSGTLAELEVALAQAERRFREAPPSIHGTYEYRSEREILTYELWVDWPAFRLSMSGRELQGTDAGELLELYTIATADGKRFGVRDPASDETYITRDFGEGLWVLGPMLTFFGGPIDDCVSRRVLRTELVYQRPAIVFRCLEFDDFDSWVDRETGLVLRQVIRDPSETEPDWIGFVDVEFDPALDPGMFDPRSV